VLLLLQSSPVHSAGAEITSDSFQRLFREAAIVLMKEGNTRYTSGQLSHPNLDPERRHNTVSEGQQPFATVLACSDSRDPVELIFDRGIGDLFVIRVAGNVAGDSEMATIEYGLGHLNCPLLVVMGHSKCGAVTAVASGAKLHGHLPKLAERIQPAVDKAKAKVTDPADLVPKAIEENVWQVIANVLKQSPEVHELVAKGKVQVMGAIYDLESGQVAWLGAHPDQKALLAAPPIDDSHESHAVAAHSDAASTGVSIKKDSQNAANPEVTIPAHRTDAQKLPLRATAGLSLNPPASPPAQKTAAPAAHSH
jgi:carbonic anhydrase